MAEESPQSADPEVTWTPGVYTVKFADGHVVVLSWTDDLAVHAVPNMRTPDRMRLARRIAREQREGQ